MQRVLFRYYRVALARVAWIIALVAVGVGALLLQIDGARWLTSLLSVGVVAAVFLGCERLVRIHLWRYAYPHFDFSGKWVGATNYKPVPETPGSDRGGDGFTVHHEIVFAQDCLGIEVIPSDGKAYEGGWNSLVCSLTHGGCIEYAYEVNYDGSPRFPIDALGYERLKVIDSQTSDGRPTRLTGNFYHCVRGKWPVYNGTVRFERVEVDRDVKLGGVWRFLARLTRPLGE